MPWVVQWPVVMLRTDRSIFAESTRSDFAINGGTHVRHIYEKKSRRWDYSGDSNLTALVHFLQRPYLGTDIRGDSCFGMVAKHLVHAALVALRVRNWNRYIVLVHFPAFEQGDRRFHRLRSNQRHAR